MKTIFERPVALSILIHSLFGIAIFTFANAQSRPSVELYDMDYEKSFVVPQSLAVSAPPKSVDFEDLSQLRSVPPPTPTPTVTDLCRPVLTRREANFINGASVSLTKNKI